MKLQHGVLLTVLSMHSCSIEAGHHRIQHKHELEMAGKSGKSESMYVNESKSGKGSVQPEHSMPMTDDDAMSIVYYNGKAGKDMGSKSSKDDSTTKAKTVKTEDMSKSGKHYVDMSMHEVEDDNMSVVYLGKAEKETKAKTGKSEAITEIMNGMHVSVGKSDKLHADMMTKSGKAEELMSMMDDDVSYVYTSKAGKSSDAKASKAHYPMDAKSGKSGYASYGKSGKASHSMSMVDDMTDADGEWVPITTEAAITTVADTGDAATTVPPSQDTTVAAASTTLAPETTVAQPTSPAASTTPAAELPAFARPKREETIEEELLLLQEGHHGGKDHVHSKAGETVEVSNKIATGNHLRPEAVQAISASSSPTISTYSVVAACVASFFALSL